MSDVFPRRNLGPGEEWGREVEKRARGVQKNAVSLDQFVTGQNRSNTSQLTDLQRQAEKLRTALVNTPVSVQGFDFTSNFAVPAAWTTRAATTLVIPPGKASCDVVVRGYVNIDWVAVQTGGGERFHWPFPLSSVSQEYGPNPAYFDGMHKGIDFSQAGGTAIIAPASGTVTLNSYDSERGNWVIIDHGDGLETWYYHLQSPSPLSVGSSVVKGSTYIGPVGTTGFSTGNHLHWETRVNGNHMNPRNFMDQYANSGSTSIPYDFNCRLLIAGQVIREFRSSRDPVSGDNRFYVAGGRTFSAPSSGLVGVDLQVMSTIGVDNPAYTGTIASVMAFGVFA